MHPALRMREELADRAALVGRFAFVRARTPSLCGNLTPEDMTIQSMPDVSPSKWHLAHTTWFFEQFLLSRFEPGFEPHHERYGYLYNSYYEEVGARWARPERGLLSRPSVEDVLAYREAVDARVTRLADHVSEHDWTALAPLLELGLHHEQQHQELICTDIKHVLSLNPLQPSAFGPALQEMAPAPGAVDWIGFEGGLLEMGHGEDGFAFDNELPRHTCYAAPFALADRPVVNAEFLAFMEDGGYERAELWLSDGWAARHEHGWRAPLYWRREEEGWFEFTLHGLERLNPAAPVTHISLYEAAAFARWAKARLPREHELEFAARQAPHAGRFYTPGWRVHPLPIKTPGDGALRRVYGDVWEWTQSPYSAFPGYDAPEGAVGEYNGKFMCNQFVLRGGSAVTPKSHIRKTYRNFFPPDARWQFTGIRLARDAYAS
ncbi:MAG: ergothioneine biosynthesis protein EgtB [Caulobacterales bacterium]|nr:ergothioneine biosynthesis protein EgtB [Caulobacterales bacterium]